MQTTPELRVFQFDSGGPDSFSPFGRWEIELDSVGHLSVRLHRGDRHTDFAQKSMATVQNESLWRLVDALGIGNLQSSTRQPVPDEGAYTLRLLDPQHLQRACIWRNDALRDPRIVALIEELTRVIEQATGFHPVVLR